jgi:threonine dehydratase
MSFCIQGVLEARRVVYRFLRPTPLVHYPILSSHLGCEVWVKHENANPTGAFKIRGGLNLVSRLSPAERRAGLITATRGNHGQSIALACKLFEMPCTIVVPEGNNPEKNEAMLAYGAKLIIHGRDFDGAREQVEEIQRKTGMRYVHSGNEPHLVHGVGTYALEIFEDLPDADVVIVPVGGGSGVCGVLAVALGVRPGIRVIGVQAEQAAAVYQSWKSGRDVVTETAETIADGLATRAPFALPIAYMRDHLKEMVVVSEGSLRQAVLDYLRMTHHLAEPAAAAALAAAFQLRESLKGHKVVLVLSGSNIASGVLAEILCD